MKKKSRPSSVPSTTPAAPAKPAWVPAYDEIAAEAAALWRKKGSPQGCDEEIWLEAEQNLHRRHLLKRDERDLALLADPRFAFNQDKDDLMSELDARFPDQTGDATTSL